MACLIADNTIDVFDNSPISGTTVGFQGTQTFKFSIIYNEIVTFSVALNNVTGGIPNAKLKLFKIEVGDILTQVGTASLTSFNNTFTYDSIVGDYLICLESIVPTNYTLITSFTTYDGVLLQPLIALNGQNSEVKFKGAISSQCKSDVNFKFLHGELPKNFTFRSDGIIYGEAQEQDCESDSNEAPSYTWVETNEDGVLDSTGRPYTFTLRAFLEDFPEVFDDRVFQICVRNNWSYDVTTGADINVEYECVVLE